MKEGKRRARSVPSSTRPAGPVIPPGQGPVEEARRESEGRYRSLAESAQDFIYIIDRQGRVTYLNPAAARLFGRQPQELIGQRATDLFAPGTFDRQQQHLLQVFQTGRPLSVAAKTVVGDREIWQDTTLTPLSDESGQVIEVLGVSRDITERKKAEEALQAAQQQLAVILDTMPGAVVYLTPDQRIVWANRAAGESVGLEPAQMVGRLCYELWGPGETPCPGCPVLRVVATGQPEEHESLHPDGRVWHVYGYPVYGTDGEIMGLVDAAVDVTARRRADDALRMSEHQYRTTIDSMRDPIHVVGPDLRFILYNQALQQWIDELHLGPEVIGRTVFELFPFLPEHVREEYRHVFRTGEMLITEDSTWIDGREFITETRKIPVVEDDKVVRVVTVLHDITDRKRAERELRESEERYRAVVQDQTELICRFLPDWTITFANEAYCRYFGRPCAELVGTSFMPLIPREDWDKVQQQISSLSREHPVVTYEDRALLSSGEIRWQQWTDRAVFDEQGQLVEYQSVGRDITERKQAEAALRESEARYRTLVETSPDAITLTDLEGRILMVNQRAVEVYGVTSADELIGKSAVDLIVVPDRAVAIANLQLALTTGYLHNTEYRITRRDGTSHPVELTASLLRDAQGQPEAFIGVTRDITERKRAEEVLWQTKMVVEHSPVILYRLRAEEGWPFEFVSENVAQSGYTAADLLSGRVSFASLIHPEDLPRVLGEMEEYAERGVDTFRREYRCVLKNGAIAWVEDRVVIVRGPDGRVTHYQGILLDVTENKRLEEQFRQAQKMETVGRLAGGIAHDFNNFLTAIRGYAGLVHDALRPEDPVRADIAQVLQAAERAASLTSQLLAFSRRQIIEPRPANLNDLVLETEKMVHRLVGEDIELALVLTSNLGLVRVDPGQITQALVNLVVNARDAMPDGGVLTIETANVTLDQEYANEHTGVMPGPFVMLTVSDTGVGMSEEVKAHLFEPFFTTKEVGRGTGLGLATVYGIVKQHQGHITVQSAAGQGTTVRIYLPQVKEKVRPASWRGAAERMPSGNETVLVVEDEPAVRALMVRVLRSVGYTVLEAADGDQAVQVAREREGKIHLLLTDVVMPQMDGKMLVSLLKDAYGDLKVLYVSGYATDVLSRYGVLEEGVALLHKPFTGAALANKVREVLDAEGR